MAVLVIVTMSFNACTKTIEKQVNQAVSGKANGARLEGNTYGKDVSKEDLEDVMNLENPMRDVLRYLKNGGRLPETKHFKDFLSYFKTGKKEGIIGNGSYPWGCSNTPSSSTGLVVLGYPGAPPCGGSTNQRIGNTTFANASSALDCPTYIQDAFGNKIYVLGMYGTADERQGYYVYLPDNYNANSKIVVLIHGGAWMEALI